MKIKFTPNSFTRSYLPYLAAMYLIVQLIATFNWVALVIAIPLAYVFHRAQPLK